MLGVHVEVHMSEGVAERVDIPGPWQKRERGEGMERRDQRGWLRAHVLPPGELDKGRWGWFAMIASGEAMGGRASSLEDGMTAADAALAELSGGPS